ncbi:unnamed protein product [Phaedon cochleariae]|uniref:Uncharacterized protein n=1 Tax=Phaedon cochleariae TaxID=80249 RepID=A0A9P0DV02_PHACE|nr:unnamed protein product [Phaedon cochleariae]
MRVKMTEHGAALQTYNQELVKCLEDLKIRKNEVRAMIYKEQAEKVVIEKNIKALQDKLLLLTQNLQQHEEMYESYETTIQETENGFRKILESSQTLLHMVQHEVIRLDSSQNISLDNMMIKGIPSYHNENVNY